MPSSSMHLSLLAGVAILLTSAGAGLAQNQYGPPPGPPGPNGEPPAQTPESQAARLRATLRLRPDQEAALQAFIRANATTPGAIDRMRRQEESAASLPTPRRLDFMLARMDEMRGLMVTRMAATKRFYAELTPSQQRAFDALGSTSGHH